MLHQMSIKGFSKRNSRMSCFIQQIISRLKPWISKYYNSIQLYKYLFNTFYQQGAHEDSGGPLSLCYQGVSEVKGRIK